ncbi:hypothetical protein ACHAWF_012272 [Thalassiosira exigua]
MMQRYKHALPGSRLGAGHETLEAFQEAVAADGRNGLQQREPKEFSLVVILSRDANIRSAGPSRDQSCDAAGDADGTLSILLGKKLRGFGEGFFNSPGGKLEADLGERDRPALGAVREVREETGIDVPLRAMEEGFVGTINFTFEDSDLYGAMRVRLFCVFVTLSDDDKCNSQPAMDGSNGIEAKNMRSSRTAVAVRPGQIRGCDEIEPRWFDHRDIPLDQMFADDSLWLTKLLTHYDRGGADAHEKFTFDAWFHFQPGGTETNTVMHHFIQIHDGRDGCAVPGSPKVTLERKLFHALHDKRVQSPSIKEFKENWALANAVRKFLKDDGRMEYVIDVAGGHGALGALFLLLVPACRSAVVVDPAECPSGERGVREAWGQFWAYDRIAEARRIESGGKELRYRRECLRTGLAKELDIILETETAKCTSVTVVACHACQHLTDETMKIASEYGVNVAVMPCCQKDLDGRWKGIAKRLVRRSNNSESASLTIGALMDLLAAGKMMGWQTGAHAGVRYDVKMKLMDESISTQNRMILCKAIVREAGIDGNVEGEKKKALAHERLTRAYHRAHGGKGGAKGDRNDKSSWCIPSILTGFCLGAAFSVLIAAQIRKNN